MPEINNRKIPQSYDTEVWFSSVHMKIKIRS